MLYISNPKIPKYLTLPTTESVFISSHTKKDGITVFTYEIPINVNTGASKDIDGDLQLRIFSSKKKPEKIVVKTSVIAASNILKSIDRQKINQTLDQNLRKKFFYKKFVDKIDLLNPTIRFQIEISNSQIFDTFTIEAVNIKKSGQISIFDSVEISHVQLLQKYDLPSDDFLLTTTRHNRRKIYASATTDDKNIGYFRFLLRNDAGSTFKPAVFSTSIKQPIEHTNISTAIFDVADNDQKYTIRAYPVSAILDQEIGNFKQETCAFVKSVKQMAFYMSQLADDYVTFNISNIDSFVEKVFLYRQSSLSHDRVFVSSSVNTSNSITITDKARQPQYDYIYTIDYLDRDGNTVTCPTEVIVLSLKLDTIAKLKVLQVANTGSAGISTANSSVSFNVEIEYDTTTLYDQIYSDIKSLGSESIFSTDLKKMTNNLKPITRVLVSRISLITGIETNIGVFPSGIITIPNEDFDPCIFRFEVAVRSAPEALESITAAQGILADNSFNQKSAIDLTSKLIGNLSKTSRTSFSSKFFSKSSLKDSTIRYGNSSSLADISYFAGRTGIFSDIIISTPKKANIVIRDIKTLLTQKGNYIKWNATGDVKNIDYFLITLDDSTFMSHPAQKSIQNFYIGNLNPKKVTIVPVFIGSNIESINPTLGG